MNKTKAYQEAIKVFEEFTEMYSELKLRSDNEAFTIAWTNGIYPNFLPWFNERNQTKPPKLSTKPPKKLQNSIVVKLDNQSIKYTGFYSTESFINAERFYIYEMDKAIQLHFSYGRKSRVLDGVVILIKSDMEQPAYSFSYFKDVESERFAFETYSTENGQIDHIKEEGFSKSNYDQIEFNNDVVIHQNSSGIEILAKQSNKAEYKKIFPK